MISFTSAQLDHWVAMLLFPLARILALVASSPALGNKQVPARVKVGLSVFIALLVAPQVPVPDVAVGTAPGLLILAEQIVIGLAMGFSMRLIFTAVEMAGELAGLQMGLGFASFYDPINSSYTPIVARWLGTIAILFFLVTNGHLFMLAGVVESFQALPPGQAMQAAGFREVVNWGGSIFAYAAQISLPLLGALLITNVALGILTRAAPQLNLFAVGFPITMTIGFMVLLMSMPYFAPLFDRLAQEGLGTMMKVIMAH